MQPTKPGGVSTLGAFVNTAADNLRGQGADIREALIKLSQTFSALGDHSNDIFSTVKNLSVLVSALHDSTDLLGQLNQNLAAVTGLLANDPNEVGQAVKDLNDVVGDVQSFVADNREALGTTSDKLASISRALVESIPDIKQTLHVAAPAFSNFLNIYEPIASGFTGTLAVYQFPNPISFLCGAIQAASRLGAEQSAKLCVQYLAPIVKNRQYNFPPIGENLIVGAQARPNEVTFSEDWMRPDYVPPAVPPPQGAPGSAEAPASPSASPAPSGPPLAAEAAQPQPVATDPAAGLPGMMASASWRVMTHILRRRARAMLLAAILAVSGTAGCGWQGANSLPLPGTEGHGPGSYTIQAQMPDIKTLQPNSRVRVNDVTVGTVTKIERQDWHALITITLNGDVDLPANATATLGQTSLLGSLHVELAPPTDVPPQGKLHQGSLIPLPHAGIYPTTEQTLAALSLVLNGGGVGQLQDIIKSLHTAFSGREEDVRSLIQQLDKFVTYVNDQTDDIIAATDSLNDLAGQFADKKPVLDRALRTIPDALAVLKDERNNLAETLDQLGKFGAVAADSVNQTKQALVQELKDLGPVLESLANAGPALTRSLSLIATYPWPNETLENWCRGDYCNLTGVFDLTLSRIDSGLFTGTRWECDLTELELQWGRTIGQQPSPCMSGGPYNPGNPLVVPYRYDQGP